MNNKKLSLICIALITATSTSAGAWEFRCRFVERVGTVDVPLPDDTIDASNGNVRNIRIQFGVFDDASGPAPAGGFIGWNPGSLLVSGPEGNSDERRNPGRISPFNSGGGPSPKTVIPPGSSADPFTELHGINATIGLQSPIWVCPPDQSVPPPPPAPVRGRNTFVSVYAISINPNPGAVDYTITASGALLAAIDWQIVGTPVPPDCGDPVDPADDIPGSITYAPFTAPAREFSCTLNVNVPSPPGATVLIFVGGVALLRRGRRRCTRFS